MQFNAAEKEGKAAKDEARAARSEQERLGAAAREAEAGRRAAEERARASAAELDALKSARAADAKRLRERNEALKSQGDALTKLQAEQASRAEAERRLSEARQRLQAQQLRTDAMATELRAAQATPRASRDDKSGRVSELERQLADALKKAREATEELERKQTEWRLTALKRHAEMNKVQQELKVATQNEVVLKKKADMLELTLLSHQKSMEKGRAKMVQDQIKERGEQITAQNQGGLKTDLHAQATKRPTFEKTFNCQMDAIEAKLKKNK